MSGFGGSSMKGIYSRPLRSASWNRSSTGTGTNTQFSGLGNTPTGELSIGLINILYVNESTYLKYAFMPAGSPSSIPVFRATWMAW